MTRDKNVKKLEKIRKKRAKKKSNEKKTWLIKEVKERRQQKKEKNHFKKKNFMSRKDSEEFTSDALGNVIIVNKENIEVNNE